jgi:ribose transport system permease protein
MIRSNNIGLDILKRIAGTIYIPAAIYILIFLIARNGGIDYFGNANTWRNILLSTGATATIAFALAIQIRNDRFDFSGGSVMTLGALVSIYIVKHVMPSGILYLLISIVICTALSTIVALVYVYGRIPIVICTVGAAIFFESITLVFNGGHGVSIASNTALNFLGKKVGPLCVLLVISGLVYMVFTIFTTPGKKSELLASNQLAAVNIGVKERKNVIQTFVVTGALYGIASVVYASQAFQVDAVSSVLLTVNTAFGSLLPVFMGFYIGSFSTGAVGIIFSSLAIGILYYGIEVIAPTGYAGAFENIIMAVFMIMFFLVSKKGPKIAKWVAKKYPSASKAA